MSGELTVVCAEYPSRLNSVIKEPDDNTRLVPVFAMTIGVDGAVEIVSSHCAVPFNVDVTCVVPITISRAPKFAACAVVTTPRPADESIVTDCVWPVDSFSVRVAGAPAVVRVTTQPSGWVSS